MGQSQPDTNAIIYGWTLSDYLTPELTDIDTGLTQLQIHNPFYENHGSFTHLGNIGTRSINNNYLKRKNEEFIFLNSVFPLFTTYDNAWFYNTKKPYSHILYTNGNPRSQKEETLDIIHSQNAKEKFNFGFKYNLIASKGQYRYLDVKRHRVNTHASFTGTRYTAHGVFNLNRYVGSENGGVIEDEYKNNSFKFTKEIPTIFDGEGDPKYEPNARTKYRYTDFMISQKLKLFQIGGESDTTSVDSLVSGSFAEPIISHIIKGRRVAKIHEDLAPYTTGYYDNIYGNVLESYDSAGMRSLSNTLQVEFKTVFRQKHLVGVYGNISHEYRSLSDKIKNDTSSATVDTLKKAPLLDSLGYEHIRHFNNYTISTGIYSKLWGRFTSKFSLALCFLGDDKVGDLKLDGLLSTEVELLKQTWGLDLYAKNENKNVSQFYNLYHSNNYIWENEFDPRNEVLLSGTLWSPSNKLRLYSNYALISNEMYFDKEITPKQSDAALSYLNVGLEKDFYWWKFVSKNALVFQKTKDEIIRVPSFIFSNTTFIDHTWFFKITGGELRTMLGFDLFYTSSHNGIGYSPALATFYNMDGNTVSNSPLIDVFLNIKLKRVRAFFKLQSVNTEIFDAGENYSAVYYPQNLMSLKYGIAWTFYD